MQKFVKEEKHIAKLGDKNLLKVSEIVSFAGRICKIFYHGPLKNNQCGMLIYGGDQSKIHAFIYVHYSLPLFMHSAPFHSISFFLPKCL
jgi:hypothetical protein